MKRLILLGLAAAALAAPSFLLVPGRGVGPLRADTRRADLERLLELEPAEVADGTAGADHRPSTEVWPLDKSRRLTLLWSGEKLGAVLLSGESSRWKTAEGITLGTSLATLARLNGRPLLVQAFTGEHAGEVVDWQDGRLAAYYAGLILTLTWRAPGYNKLTGTQKEALEKPGRLASDQPLLRALNPVVSTLELRL